jgi:hypothetical protein
MTTWNTTGYGSSFVSFQGEYDSEERRWLVAGNRGRDYHHYHHHCGLLVLVSPMTVTTCSECINTSVAGADWSTDFFFKKKNRQDVMTTTYHTECIFVMEIELIVGK